MRSGPSLLLGLLAASCAGRFSHFPHTDPCAASASAGGVPFDSTRAASLVGRYRLTVVSDWEDERGRSESGELTLQLADTLHQFYERRGRTWIRKDSRPLWGWTDVQRKRVLIPWSADPALRDPDHPGVFVHSSGVMELGVWRGMDGGELNFVIERVSPNGFGGTWNSDLGNVALVKDDRTLPDPHGHFCAVRQP